MPLGVFPGALKLFAVSVSTSLSLSLSVSLFPEKTSLQKS
jgi:hypothetical protein